MSLLTDPDYLIHQLRLTYLRHVDDPYGPRVLALNPAYASNPHISASGLADQELWPEIVMSSTPTNDTGLSKDGNKRHSGFPGANLNYTQTIVGQNRTGAMGMRVNAKRTSLIREPAPASTANGSHVNGKRHRSDSEPTPVVPSPSTRELDPAPEKPTTSTLLRRQSVDASELEAAPAPVAPVAAVPPKVLPFKPPFARAAEMEARRKLRMRSRFASTDAQPKPIVTLEKDALNPEVSDGESSGEEDSDIAGNDVPLEGEDFFDPENSFGPRIVLDASVSDGLLSTSNSGMSTSHSSGPGAYNSTHLNVHPAPRARLSPVREGRSQSQQENEPSTPSAEPSFESSKARTTPQRTYRSEGSYFELVVPPMQGRGGHSAGTQNSDISQGWTVDPSSNLTPVPGVASPSHITDEYPQQTLTFTRVKVPSLPTRPTPSGLSLILASKASKTDNPFSELYALISSRSNPLSLEIVYPFSDNPRKAVTLKARPDATVEEVIGFALWTYWEEGFTPKLDDVDEAKKKDRLSAAGWSLRVTEDGDVDDDFPAMDRMAKMSKFSFEGYAILPETPAQAEQNHINEAKIVRRPSRVMVAKKKAEPAQSLAPPAGVNGATSSSLSAQAPISTSISGGSSISHGPQQFLRVRVDEKTDVHFLTTIPVKESMYMEEVLENVCRKRRIDDPKQWCLVYDLKILIPLDRTVASLQGKNEIFLLKREQLSRYDIRRQHTRSTDPNASIFTRNSEVPEQQYSAALDFTRAYKKYTVYRKMPMLVVRHERILAMDGDYIHIMPSQTRAFLDSMKTSSYHVRSVVACTQSAKSSSNFKLVVTRDGGNKRYDFEAENPKIAATVLAEIVRSIRDLRSKRVDRTSTVGRSRRSRPPT
ncbi:stress-activated map kinase interacting protein 1-domain-containing protein [Hysterangium stoloniferum]|nr:stress-activated map kinase interacting protein 1-domain-containing protein [Hysterangium stoloniferum]